MLKFYDERVGSYLRNLPDTRAQLADTRAALEQSEARIRQLKKELRRRQGRS